VSVLCYICEANYCNISQSQTSHTLIRQYLICALNHYILSRCSNCSFVTIMMHHCIVHPFQDHVCISALDSIVLNFTLQYISHLFHCCFSSSFVTQLCCNNSTMETTHTDGSACVHVWAHAHEHTLFCA